MKYISFLLCVLVPTYIFSMNRDIDINNMCKKPVTVYYQHRWGSNFTFDLSKVVEPKERLLLKVSMKDPFVNVIIPGFNTAEKIAVKQKSSILIKQENQNEIIISQGFDILAIMKAVNRRNTRLSPFILRQTQDEREKK